MDLPEKMICPCLPEKTDCIGLPVKINSMSLPEKTISIDPTERLNGLPYVFKPAPDNIPFMSIQIVLDFGGRGWGGGCCLCSNYMEVQDSQGQKNFLLCFGSFGMDTVSVQSWVIPKSVQ